MEALLNDDSGKLLTQALYPKDYIFTYLMNPSSVHLFDKTQVQLQSLAAIKFLLTTPVYKKKENVQKIIEDLEKKIEFSHENTLRHWK